MQDLVPLTTESPSQREERQQKFTHRKINVQFCCCLISFRMSFCVHSARCGDSEYHYARGPRDAITRCGELYPSTFASESLKNVSCPATPSAKLDQERLDLVYRGRNLISCEAIRAEIAIGPSVRHHHATDGECFRCSCRISSLAAQRRTVATLRILFAEIPASRNEPQQFQQGAAGGVSGIP